MPANVGIRSPLRSDTNGVVDDGDTGDHIRTGPTAEPAMAPALAGL